MNYLKIFDKLFEINLKFIDLDRLCIFCNNTWILELSECLYYFLIKLEERREGWIICGIAFTKMVFVNITKCILFHHFTFSSSWNYFKICFRARKRMEGEDVYGGKISVILATEEKIIANRTSPSKCKYMKFDFVVSVN